MEVPVAGSGDVFSYDDACRMRDRCGVDAVHVARGARGNPWIFTGHEPSHAERVAAMHEHFELYLHYADPGSRRVTGVPRRVTRPYPPLSMRLLRT